MVILLLGLLPSACGSQRTVHGWQGGNTAAAKIGPQTFSWQNAANPLDVNGDGVVTRLDLDRLVAELQETGTYSVPKGIRPTEFLDVDGNGEINWEDSYPLYAIFVPWHRAENPMDVNGDGFITAGDALAVISYLNQIPSSEGSPLIAPNTPRGDYGAPDVNGDNFVNALDSLIIINHLNK